jgi:lipopolysaccharide transport system permease protein
MQTTFSNTQTSPGYAFDVIKTLVGRELQMRYKGSSLGLLWAVLSPLGLVAVMHIVFTTILPLGIEHYAAFVYAGLLPWTWFQSVVITSATTLFDNRDLVRRPFFPRILLPAVVTTTNFLLYLLAMPVLICLILIDGVAITPMILWLPAIWVVLGVLALGFGTLFAALGVLMRDVQHILAVIMTLWFYLTPIFYSAERLGPQQQWLLVNPLSTIVNAHRHVLIDGTPPDWGALGICLLGGLILLATSIALFRTLEDAFVEEV